MIVISWPWFMINITGLFDSDTGDRKGYRAMSFLCFIILRDEKDINDKVLLNHEIIHYKQQLELFFVGQWFLYVLFYAINILKGYNSDKAYKMNYFEQEAYDNEDDLSYLNDRKLFSWLKYIKL